MRSIRASLAMHVACTNTVHGAHVSPSGGRLKLFFFNCEKRYVSSLGDTKVALFEMGVGSTRRL